MCFKHLTKSAAVSIYLTAMLLTPFLLILSMTLPATFMLFLYPCVVVSLAYALKCSEYTLWTVVAQLCWLKETEQSNAVLGYSEIFH
jgi:hypothetical protein